ncbi:MAG TPA: redoxin domain-containing protein, partial [Candidatus Limnocylindrales bacterium]|nr:redoxin domain-containing protein [Candidatus Limnocylindrales bacterium]
MATESRPPIQPGERAPDFVLPTINREGTVSLADYRGKSPLFLAVFRGLWCPFCRRAITELGPISDKLRATGVETLVVVASDLENSRLYFKFRPSRVPLAADPECATHRAYGIPKVPMTPETMQALQTTRINPTGELPAALPVAEAGAALDRLQNFQSSPTDQTEYERQVGQLKGQFLLDRDGV